MHRVWGRGVSWRMWRDRQGKEAHESIACKCTGGSLSRDENILDGKPAIVIECTQNDPRNRSTSYCSRNKGKEAGVHVLIDNQAVNISSVAQILLASHAGGYFIADAKPRVHASVRSRVTLWHLKQFPIEYLLTDALFSIYSTCLD